MIIDTENLSSLTLPEVAALLLLYDKRVEKSTTVVEIRDVDIEKLLNKLVDKGLVISSIYATNHDYKPPVQHTSWALIQAGRQVLAENCNNNKKIKKIILDKNIKDRCDALALKLQEVYPDGVKQGTRLKWRDSQDVISTKLKKLLEKGAEFTDEEAVNATKAYVSGFNGRYEHMRVLKYFLSKNELKGGDYEYSCDFMSYVEDLRNNNGKTVPANDWDIELK